MHAQDDRNANFAHVRMHFLLGAANKIIYTLYIYTLRNLKPNVDEDKNTQKYKLQQVRKVYETFK